MSRARPSSPSGHSTPAPKSCASCGRAMEYRKKWARNWDSVKFCSDECRANKNRFDYREAILSALRARGPRQSIEAGDLLSADAGTEQLEHVRRSARLLAVEGSIELLQDGRVVDATQFRGAVRMRLKG